MPANVTQGPQGGSNDNGLRPQHASVPRPAGLAQDCKELWRNDDMLTDMRPSCVEPKPAPFGVGTTIDGAGCGEVSGSCKVPTGLPSAKQEDVGLRPGSIGLRPESGGLRPESAGLRPGSVDMELMVLSEVAQGFREVRKESASISEQYVVSKLRMKLARDSIDSGDAKKELQQFDQWIFGKQLA